MGTLHIHGDYCTAWVWPKEISNFIYLFIFPQICYLQCYFYSRKSHLNFWCYVLYLIKDSSPLLAKIKNTFRKIHQVEQIHSNTQHLFMLILPFSTGEKKKCFIWKHSYLLTSLLYPFVIYWSVCTYLLHLVIIEKLCSKKLWYESIVAEHFQYRFTNHNSHQIHSKNMKLENSIIQ